MSSVTSIALVFLFLVFSISPCSSFSFGDRNHTSLESSSLQKSFKAIKKIIELIDFILEDQENREGSPAGKTVEDSKPRLAAEENSIGEYIIIRLKHFFEQIMKNCDGIRKLAVNLNQKSVSDILRLIYRLT